MASAEKSLKDKNRYALFTLIILNCVVLYPFMHVDSFRLFDVLTKEWIGLVPAASAFVVTSVIVEVLDANNKARLVFWRWNHPLPGARAFSEYMQTDDRVDAATLARKIGPLPISPKEQNALWYKLYIARQHDPRILQVHRSFLFTRDYCAISAMLLGVVAPVVIWLMPPKLAVTYFGILLGQYLLVRVAAKHHGERLVTTVLALATTE